jgi:hypothetical protein
VSNNKIASHTVRWAQAAEVQPAGKRVAQPNASREPSVREFFTEFAWFGEAPDPDALIAREFLRWLA